MVDAEASKYRGDAHSSSSDSLQEVLFKDPPVTPPPVAVNMCVTPALRSRHICLTRACRSAVGACGLAAPETLRQRPRLKFLFETR